ncbi:MAG: DUF3822 family protein [Prevotella sp.]|nr:DUF3822 family protein [Prevotella sp.]
MQETSHIPGTGQRLIIRIGQSTIALLTINEQHAVNYEETEMKGGISVAANVREWLKAHSQLTDSHDQTDILLHTPTLLEPYDEFDAADADMLYKYTFTGHDRDVVNHHELSGLHAVAVFGIDKDLHMVMADHFATCRWFPVCLPVWQHEGNNKDNRSRKRLHVYLHDGHADVFSFNGRLFMFSNSFVATHAKDVLYYVLNAFTQQGMKASRDEVVVLGSMANKQWLVQQLETYVGKVSVAEVPALLPDAPSLPPMPEDLILLTSQ